MKKDEIMKALEGNMDILPAKKKTVEDADIVHDTETDVEFVRDNLKNLISKSSEALEHLSVIAQETEHPRAFEVLSNMIKQTGDLTTELLDVQKKRKDITQEKNQVESGRTTNNAIFVGSTKELQQMLKKAEDVTEE
jgi:uncharacterized membrane protein|tara:strand:- start:457 stop:867 length:411 start_codon:yes stop_codon:yes gene_type:complete